MVAAVDALGPAGNDGLSRPRVALAHDYATQMGGAERVALILAKGFPDAPLHVTLYHQPTTFPEFSEFDVRPSALNRVAVLRRFHRLALPFLAAAASRIRVDADVTLVSSTGWAHGVRTSGRKVVYCHAPARWLYQTGRYVGSHQGRGLRGRCYGLAVATAVATLGPLLRRWDQAAARSADRYLANSTVTKQAIREAYGIEAEVLPPPPALLPAGAERAVPGVEPGYFLCVARLLGYKNVDVVIEGVRQVPGARLVVVGDGPERQHLSALVANEPRIRLVGRIPDDQLRWLYRNCTALVAASYEDFGLSPLEAATFGRPSVALRAGGFLDTVVEGTTGVFFDEPKVAHVAEAVAIAGRRTWDEATLRAHAETFSVASFLARLHTIVAEEAQEAGVQKARTNRGPVGAARSA